MSEMALNLIRQAKAEKWKTLDLGRCGIIGAVPDEVGELEDLEELILSDEWWDFDSEERKSSQNNGPNNEIVALAALAPTCMKRLIAEGTGVNDLLGITGLGMLQYLNLGNTQVADITPLATLTALQNLNLSSTKVADIAPLAVLTTLKSLSLRSTPIIDIGPLAGLLALKSLFLSGTKIGDIAPLAELTALNFLLFSGTKVDDIAPLEGLVNLLSLQLLNTKVTDVEPLAGLHELQTLELSLTKVSDIAPLTGLRALLSLALRNTLVTDISPLANLKMLTTLDLSGTPIRKLSALSNLGKLARLGLTNTPVCDVTPLSKLSNLTNLTLSGTDVENVTALGKLGGLKFLDISYTPVATIEPLKALSRLSTLDISGTHIVDFSPLEEISKREKFMTIGLDNTSFSDLALLKTMIERGMKVVLKEGGGIMVENCPITNPPIEIVAQGNAAILKYWAERENQGTAPIQETKLLIVGEGGVGKTTLLRRLYCPEMQMPDGTESTKGIQIHQHAYPIKDDQNMTLNVWDFGGQEIYHATHQFFLTKRSMYVLVDDTRADDTKAEDAKFKYWLEMIELLGGDSPVLIFQNEKSGRSKDLDKLGIRKQFPNVQQEFYAGDLNDAASADQLRSAIARIAQGLPHVGEAWPRKWYEIRLALEAIAKEKPFISLQEYFALYKDLYEANESGALSLSAWLHDLGVLLHFQDDELLRELLILQNEWGTDAVFKVLDDEPLKKAHGYFTALDCERIWKATHYKGKQKELRQLMVKFELCYELRDRAATWLAPQLLPEAPTAHGFEPAASDLCLRYEYDVMPKGLVSRLMVRMNRYVKAPAFAWRNGVLFDLRGTQLLVEIPFGKKEIHMRARGEDPRILLHLISEDLDAINLGFEGLTDKVRKMIPCNCPSCANSTQPHLFHYEKLLEMRSYGVPAIQCLSRPPYHHVPIEQLLEGIGFREEQSPIQVISIFLASSLELKDDREAFEIFINRQNKHLIQDGIFLHLEIWEDSLEAMSPTRSQDEYNKIVRDCDVFVSLFFTRVGPYTEEEFGVALDQFKKSGRPMIYTYFKDADVKLGTMDERILSLFAFKKRLSDLGHFPGNYQNIEHLKEQFANQLRRILELKQGK